MLLVCLFYVIVAIFDYFIVKNIIGKWFIIHAVFNMIAVWQSLSDCYIIFSDPLSEYPNNNLYPCSIVLAIHIYHMTVFRNLKTIDWIHHIIMMSLILIPFVSKETITISNAIVFFTSGLPGGIDYVFLALAKHNKLSWLKEKQYNTMINVWIRSPGILYCVFVIYIRRLYLNSMIPWLIVLLAMSILMWNGQYFMRRVVYSYGFHSCSSME